MLGKGRGVVAVITLDNANLYIITGLIRDGYGHRLTVFTVILTSLLADTISQCQYGVLDIAMFGISVTLVCYWYSR